MGDVSSGHGGDFELDPNNNYKPSLEFTLPKFRGKIQFTDSQLTNMAKTESTGIFPDQSLPDTHPNKRPVQPHPGLEIGQNYLDGRFKIFKQNDDETLQEVQDYAIKYFANVTPKADIAISDGNGGWAVEFKFDMETPETYVALVLYNFRDKKTDPHPVLDWQALKFSNDSVELHIRCYVYIVAANQANPNPQKFKDSSDPFSTQNLASIAASSLYINLNKLATIMLGNPANISSSVEMYYAPAPEINHTNLADWNIDVTHIAQLDVGSGTEKTFTLTPNDFSVPGLPAGHIPLGLYIFGLPANSPELIIAQQQSKVNINTASPEQLGGVTGIGPTLAADIIEERNVASFCHIRDIMRVSGIGPDTFANLENEIEV
ncbi:MAG: helix-hairpin-helix domain-containing protein [Caldilineaceae bacterium]